MLEDFGRYLYADYSHPRIRYSAYTHSGGSSILSIINKQGNVGTWEFSMALVIARLVCELQIIRMWSKEEKLPEDSCAFRFEFIH